MWATAHGTSTMTEGAPLPAGAGHDQSGDRNVRHDDAGAGAARAFAVAELGTGAGDCVRAGSQRGGERAVGGRLRQVVLMVRRELDLSLNRWLSGAAGATR